MCKSSEKANWQFPINVQLPRSKWDSEDEDRLSNDIEKQQDSKAKPDAPTSDKGKPLMRVVLVFCLL